ncbi:MAG TPA: dicarboxylate/amino acid:cation symporter [Gemmatimonas aurantiaca]|uniref:C4-dicarboxylate transport protein n=2 Tax=Gemmatimonas aurantiaca TaxID=173480 RepID=C1A3K1_GEMAT|nr:dicarboxylate/amino acid:cation symporter [Gemmatimonas aurantiaca]BAH37078.1 C4-dicarboxylate transport protein [Gemmatimonas aurantiaca T-27]HCT58890.1 dicarboxylate/amino acid:cation symporter [Gemmatimonas aurantiaca]
MLSRLARNLTFQVLVAVTIGVLIGVVAPDTGKALKPIGDTFINLVKMVITPIIFLTIVHGIASMADLRKLGRVGGKALLYFEIVSTLALAIGLVIVNVTKPGAGLDISAMATGDVSKYTTAGQEQSMLEFLLHIVPSNVVAAFASGELLPVVFFSVLFGVALTAVGDAGRDLIDLLVRLQAVFFRIVHIVMKVAPLGALGAMAYTVGAFGLKTLLPLGRLMLDVYATMAVFIFVVLALICRAFGFRLWPFLRYIREEILLVLGTSSSEAALPRMLEKLERYGCARPVVGLVIPTGYSFNLDGTSIYLSMAAIFIAQVYGIDLSVGEQLTLLGILMLTSKGAAGVTGSGFIVLASTLAATRTVPVEGVALLLGVDRFMSEARAITNLIGNGVATLVVSRSEGAFDDTKRVIAEEEMRRGASV